MEITIGTQYIHRTSKRKDVCTVIDVLKTFNSKNELVSTKYVSEHDFCGQIVKNYDVVAVTIQRGLLS